MRTPLIAGNWKMNNTRVEARALISALIPQIDGAKGAEALVIPPFTALDATGTAIGSANIALGAQGVFWEEKGAWTTQVSADMLLELGCKYALMGHSETRGRFGKVDDTLTSRLHYFGETDKTINAKAKSDIPIGHKLAIRDLAEGDTVIKYGVDIGRVVRGITAGEHLHVHNVKTKRW